MADPSLPLYIYNVPGRSGVGFLSESVGKVTGHLNIRGIKEATGT